VGGDLEPEQGGKPGDTFEIRGEANAGKSAATGRKDFDGKKVLEFHGIMK